MSLKNSLFAAQTISMPVPAGDPVVCRINVAGYTLDNFKKFNPEGYTILIELIGVIPITSLFRNW